MVSSSMPKHRKQVMELGYLSSIESATSSSALQISEICWAIYSNVLFYKIMTYKLTHLSILNFQVQNIGIVARFFELISQRN